MHWMISLTILAFAYGAGRAIFGYIVTAMTEDDEAATAEPVAPPQWRPITPADLAKQNLTPAQWGVLADVCLKAVRAELATYKAGALVLIYSDEDPLQTAFAVRSDLDDAVVQHLCQLHDAMEKRKNVQLWRPLGSCFCEVMAYHNN